MITLKVSGLKGAKEKIRGLMFKKNPMPIYFETRFGIHTFFVKFPIDVLILDDSNNVRVIKKNLSPNKIFLWNPKFKKVIELPRGIIEEKNIKENTKLNIET